jgi:hypothetical protein
MAKDADKLAVSFEAENTGGLLSGFLAADLARQAQQMQSAAWESQNETRPLASAIDTL